MNNICSNFRKEGRQGKIWGRAPQLNLYWGRHIYNDFIAFAISCPTCPTFPNIRALCLFFNSLLYKSRENVEIQSKSRHKTFKGPINGFPFRLIYILSTTCYKMGHVGQFDITKRNYLGNTDIARFFQLGQCPIFLHSAPLMLTDEAISTYTFTL